MADKKFSTETMAEITRVSERVNKTISEAFDQLAEEGIDYEIAACASILTAGWLLASVTEQDMGRGVNPATLMKSFIGVMMGHSTAATEALVEAVEGSTEMIRSVLRILNADDGTETNVEELRAALQSLSSVSTGKSGGDLLN